MKKERIEILPVEASDRNALQLLYDEVRTRTFTWLTKEQLETGSFDADTAGERILVAKMEDQIAGFISVWETDRFIHHLYIKSQYQGRGIGQMLIGAVRADLSGTMTLKCLVKNRQAVKFYLKNGWCEKSKGFSEQGKYILFELLAQ